MGVAADLIFGEISRRENEDAINDAQRLEQEGLDRALGFARETRDQQVELAEPFRQYGIQQANAMGELFGFNPVGDQMQVSPMPAQGAAGVGGGAPSGQFNGSGLGDRLGRAIVDRRNAGQMIFDGTQRVPIEGMGAQPAPNGPFNATITGPTPEAMSNPGTAIPANVNGQASQTGATNDNAINTEAQDQARQRFEGSLFNDALQGALGRAATGVDANFAASGNVYSGAREQAQQNTAADLGFRGVGMFTNALMGQPSTAGAQLASNAAGQFGATAGNLAMQQGNIGANSAFLRGQNINNTIQGASDSLNRNAAQVFSFLG
jgi:hypothetical protein